MQSIAINTHMHDSSGRGGLPVNIEDLQEADEHSLDYAMMDDESPYVAAVHSEGDIEDGVAFSHTMYPHEQIRKNSDY